MVRHGCTGSARRFEAGKEWLGAVVQGVSCYGRNGLFRIVSACMGAAGKACLGGARRCLVWLAWYGLLWRGLVELGRSGEARHGESWIGKSWQERQGLARFGRAWIGAVRQAR